MRAKRMFGGVGLYLDGTIFALLAGDVLYFKADGSNSEDFEAEGMAVFDPFGDPKRLIRSYHECPPRLLEDSDELCREELCLWARKAWEAGRRAQTAKSQAAKPPTGKAKTKRTSKPGGGR